MGKTLLVYSPNPPHTLKEFKEKYESKKTSWNFVVALEWRLKNVYAMSVDGVFINYNSNKLAVLSEDPESAKKEIQPDGAQGNLYLRNKKTLSDVIFDSLK